MTEVLRPGVLDGVRIAVAGAGPLGEAVAGRAQALGATLADDEPGVLVVDGAALFTSAPGVDGVRAALDGAWAAIQPVAIHPGTATAAEEVAELAAFLSSAAGAYYSGCRFDLR